MASGWPRYLAALAAFALVMVIGTVVANFAAGEEQAIAAWALIAAVGLIAAVIAFAAVEYAQTGAIASIASQFGTRTIVLMPLAIAINIILGAAVANALRIPIYLDSIGTILVGVLAGPIAGATTGFLANIIWTYALPAPFQSPYAAAFAIVAAVIGLLAGIFGRYGLLRPRPNRPLSTLLGAGVVTAAVIIGLAYLAFLGWQAIGEEFAVAPESPDPVLLVLGWLAIVLVVGTIVGLFAVLIVRRDLTAVYVVLGGAVTGIVAAVISAPISANLFGGVTGAGTDFLVAAFRQAGADIQAATLGQGLVSDPIDKIVTYFVVFLILVAMARRMKARFPQGEALIETGPELEEEPA
jgi:energy-coupling factor transport system substrate-specific component